MVSVFTQPWLNDALCLTGRSLILSGDKSFSGFCWCRFVGVLIVSDLFFFIKLKKCPQHFLIISFCTISVLCENVFEPNVWELQCPSVWTTTCHTDGSLVTSPSSKPQGSASSGRASIKINVTITGTVQGISKRRVLSSEEDGFVYIFLWCGLYIFKRFALHYGSLSLKTLS